MRHQEETWHKWL